MQLQSGIPSMNGQVTHYFKQFGDIRTWLILPMSMFFRKSAQFDRQIQTIETARLAYGSNVPYQSAP
jgi:hypothetical protein